MRVEIRLALLGIGVICILAVIVCSATSTFTQWFLGGQRDYGRGDPPAGDTEKGGYRFDPVAVLQASNPTEAFRVDSDPNADGPNRKKVVEHVTWSENDYYRVALAAVPPSWHGELSLEFVYYELSCRDLADTPQYMHYTFFNSEKDSKGRLVFSELSIGVHPTEGRVWWLLERFFRHPDRGLPLKIDLANLKITSKEALRIAEANGGSQFRQEAQDDCDIEVAMGNGSWDVGYGGAPGTFRIRIDAETGKTEIIRQR